MASRLAARVKRLEGKAPSEAARIESLTGEELKAEICELFDALFAGGVF